MEHIRCNLCSADDTNLLFKIEKAKIVKCNNCGLIYVNPRSSKEELSKLYQKGYYKNSKFFTGKYCGYNDYEGNKEGSVKTLERVQKEIRRFKQKGSLLDIGCGTGIYLGVAERDGFDVQGIEISKEGYDKAKTKFSVTNQPLEKTKFDKFDIVTIFDVIEHLTDPKDTLLRINKILNKSGLLCIITPDADSFSAKVLGSRWPEFKRWREHIYFFSKKTLTSLLEATGFELISTRTIGKYFALEDFIK